ncbi:MAG: hypothetical protein HOO93_09635 [Methyloglobulus sp.]|nr:hypothetical protein [Methyloglobulus sp.]
MNTKTLFKIVLPALAIHAGSGLQAAEKPANDGGSKVSVEATPKLYFFDYNEGVGRDRAQFLERYNYQASGFNNRSGFYPDGDLKVLVTNPQRDVFSLERLGFGIYNQRGKAKLDLDEVDFTGYYSMYRSATGGINYLYSPNQVPGGTDPLYTTRNSGYVGRFNDDSNGHSIYTIDRTRYGGGLALKPKLFGNAGSLAFKYDGYQRDGNRFATYALGGDDVNRDAPDTGTQQRWRGFNMPVNEQMNRFSVNLGSAPKGFQMAFDGTVEKFNNRANDFTIGSFANRGVNSDRINASNSPVHFIPDSTLLRGNFRITKNFGLTTVAGGYGISTLEQDSFTENQLGVGYNQGKITTNSAFLNINSAALSWVGLEGYAKYYNRDNGSTFPATGLIDPLGEEQLGVRINTIESFTYGLSATFRPTILKSTITVGWKGEDKDRDLTWSAASTATGLNGIQPQRSLYRQESFSNEGYINWVARPIDGMTVRITPSYLYAHQTGLISEPSESFNLKTRLNYMVNETISLSGYYNFKNRQNDNNTFTNALTTPVLRDGSSLVQNTDNTQQSSGFTVSFIPSERLSANAGFNWMRNDFASYFISSNRRRFEAPNSPVWFGVRDMPNYLVDTYVFSLGADFQANKKLNFSGGYTLSYSKGNNASGYIASRLENATGAIDQKVDNTLQTITLGADYAFNDMLKLRGSYAYDHYDDKVYSVLSGGYHTVMMGVSLGF